MKKIVALSLVAASLSIAACSKKEEVANNVADANAVAANAVVDANVASNVADAGNVADNAAK